MGEVDELFKRNASRALYIQFPGHTPVVDDATVTLTRADAHFTISLILLKIEEGRKGARNVLFLDIY